MKIIQLSISIPDLPLDFFPREVLQQFDEQSAIVQADAQIHNLRTGVAAL